MEEKICLKCALHEGGGIGSPIKSFSFENFSLNTKKNYNKKYIGFSVAEMAIALLIGSLILGAAAPLITKQIKNEGSSTIEREILIKNLFPKGAIMFFERTDKKCPDGWSPVATAANGLDGYYPRIAMEGASEIGQKKEQMVHKHKHVSPALFALNGSSFANTFRYGPFRNSNARAEGGKTGLSVYGDGLYPMLEAARITLKSDGTIKEGSEKEYDVTANASFLLRAFSVSGEDNNNWYMHTSDGMNRMEQFSVAGGNAVQIPVCPNRSVDDELSGSACEYTGSEGSKTIKSYSYDAVASGNKRRITVNNHPYMEDMPLVGDENRPNSIVWLACKKN